LATEFHDETNQSILKGQIHRRRQGESHSYEIAFTRKDGQQVATVVSPKPIFDSDGAFNGSFAVFTDVTQLKQVEHERRKREAELGAQSKQLQEVNTALKILLKKGRKTKESLRRAFCPMSSNWSPHTLKG
jgi:hypothetical protein